MTRPKMDSIERANLKRTAELQHRDLKEVSATHRIVTDIATSSLHNAVAFAGSKGISDLTIVNSLLQFCAIWLQGIHAGATANALRLLADQLEAAGRGDREAEGRVCEALMLNGLVFTAALNAERHGGRN